MLKYFSWFYNKPKTTIREYALIVFNHIPHNIGEYLRTITNDNNNDIRFLFVDNSFILKVRSHLTMMEIQDLTKKYLVHDDVSWLLSDLSLGTTEHYEKRFVSGMDFSTKLEVDLTIESIERFFNGLKNFNEMIKRIEENGDLVEVLKNINIPEVVQGEAISKVTTETVNKILDKIKESGIDSLTEEELQILKMRADG